MIFGCGYVGSALAEVALAGGARVTALTRNPEKAAALRARGVATIEADLASEAWHDRLAGGADFVANTVSAAAPTPEGYRASYVDGLRSILAWAGRTRVGTLVYTSSTGVYPQGGERAWTRRRRPRARLRPAACWSKPRTCCGRRRPRSCGGGSSCAAPASTVRAGTTC
ncbi:NAD-dependent epimerase/dehydratase family protein [Oleiharenicola sp. Vm1]|uniref:NAD-dependent epimerase/dehydratase family protein n=1 Tax=Oleiharenicola sp. Vm1 TaxID=3398393 RepID=UPI0039F44A05